MNQNISVVFIVQAYIRNYVYTLKLTLSMEFYGVGAKKIKGLA